MYFLGRRAVLKSSSLQTLSRAHTHAIDWLGKCACFSHTIVDLRPWYLRNPCLHLLIDRR